MPSVLVSVFLFFFVQSLSSFLVGHFLTNFLAFFLLLSKRANFMEFFILVVHALIAATTASSWACIFFFSSNICFLKVSKMGVTVFTKSKASFLSLSFLCLSTISSIMIFSICEGSTLPNLSVHLILLQFL